MNFKLKIDFLTLATLLVLFLPAFSYANDEIEVLPDESLTEDNQMPEVKPVTEKKERIFKNPVCLLVGINSNELSYRELSGLSGFELFSVPYRSDIKSIVEEINPSQVIIKHQSGFVGLYTPAGQLIRGVQGVASSDLTSIPGAVTQSIIQPAEANPLFDSVYYPGGIPSGSIASGGVGYNKQPTGKGGVWRNLLKLASFGYIGIPMYPRYFYGKTNFIGSDTGSIFGSLILPAVPNAVSALATFADNKIDAAEYDQARAQPRDYKFQHETDGY
jgi:hypothetical protein